MLRSPTRSSRFELSSPSGGEATGGRREGGGGRGETTMTSSRTSAPSTPAYPKSNDLDDFPRPLAVSYPHFDDAFLYTCSYMHNTVGSNSVP